MIAMAIILACHATTATAQENSDNWQFSITPYIWLPTISGDVNYDPPPGGGGGGDPSIDVGPTDWLELLNGVALLSAEVRKGRFSAFADLVYLGLESDEDRVASVGGGNLPVGVDLNLGTETDFDGFSWTLAAGYRLKETETSGIDVFAGVRFFGVDVTTSWNLSAAITEPGGGVVLPAQGSIGGERDFWDGIVGVRGRAGLGEGKWSVVYYLDAGTGSSDLTWQALAGLSYSYGWGDLMFAYRHLDYSEGPESLVSDLEFSGPGIASKFRF
jgi:hypothetical protein